MKSLLSLTFVVVSALMISGVAHAQSRSFSTDYVGHNVYWNGTNWVSTGAGYGSVIGPSSSTGDINFYATGNAASSGLTRTLTQAAAITPAGTVSSTAVQAYTGSFGNVNATGTISATTLKVNDLNVTNLTVNGSAYSGGGGGGTSATIIAGLPDAIICSNGSFSRMVYMNLAPYSDGQYYYATLDGGEALIFNSSKNYVSNASLSGYNCINKSIAQLYAEGKAFNFVGNSGANGTDGADNITSGTTKITANSTGYISLTTGGVTTGYFDTTGKLVVPTVSTTGAISATRGYFTQDLGVGRAIESWMPSNTIVAKGQVIADGGFAISAGTGLSWEDGHVSVASNDGTDVEMRTNYAARLKIISNGNVGINTTDPNATLDVHGTISSTNVQAYTGSFGNVNATGTVTAPAANFTNLTVNGQPVSGGGGGGSTGLGCAVSPPDMANMVVVPDGSSYKFYAQGAASVSNCSVVATETRSCSAGVLSGSYLYPSCCIVGSSWTQRDVNGSTGNWYGIAMSGDGTKLLVAQTGGYVYTSTDSGATWTKRDPAGGVKNWYGAAMSSDGTKMVVVHTGSGYVYTSADSGATWTKRAPTGSSQDWRSVAMSADGTKIIVGPVMGSYVHTSTDGGVTWTARTGATSGNFYSVAISDDGTKMAAGIQGGYLYTSTDSGATWTARTPKSGQTGYWYAIAMSSDGTKILAVSGMSGYVYTSTDTGVTWTERDPASRTRDWYSAAMSSDGTKMVAGVGQGGYIYTSTDSGVTWTQRDPKGSAGYWYGLTMSDNGAKIAVSGNYNGYVYSSICP